MALAMPRYITLKSLEERHYLRVITENGQTRGLLQCLESRVESPDVKFEVEIAREAINAGLVHIRSCQNNRYWVVPFTGFNWITATARKPDEDQSKETCTLFKPIPVDDDAAKNTFRFMHVQSGLYVCVQDFYGFVIISKCVMAISKVIDRNRRRDIFTILDWDSLVFLPKYVAFKGDNGKYLRLSWKERHPYLMFSATDIGDPAVTQEVFVTHDGNIRLKPTSCHQFWRRSPNWIWADSGDSTSSNLDTLFRPFKVDDQTIALRNLGNNNFCKRLTTEGKTSCLNAAISCVAKEAQLKVEEAVMTSKIYNTKYLLDDARVYYETVQVLVAKNSASNYTQETSSLDVKLSYTDTKTTAWKTNASLKMSAKTTLDMRIPLIFEGKVELSGEIQSGIEWSKTMTSTTVVKVVHKVVVPPMTKVTVNLLATKGKCDVPFSFTQKDVLYNGKTVVTEVEGGIYRGSNYYSINFETIKEKL